MRNPLLPLSVPLAVLLTAGLVSAETGPSRANGPAGSPAPSRQVQPTALDAPATYGWLDVNGEPLPLQTWGRGEKVVLGEHIFPVHGELCGQAPHAIGRQPSGPGPWKHLPFSRVVVSEARYRSSR
jgi:hypothetical protein